jgi:hypothetical protein
MKMASGYHFDPAACTAAEASAFYQFLMQPGAGEGHYDRFPRPTHARLYS